MTLHFHCRIANKTFISCFSLAVFFDGHDDGFNQHTATDADFTLNASQLYQRATDFISHLILSVASDDDPFSCLLYTLLAPWAPPLSRRLNLLAAMLWSCFPDPTQKLLQSLPTRFLLWSVRRNSCGFFCDTSARGRLIEALIETHPTADAATATPLEEEAQKNLVLYVSFGSKLLLSKRQMEEIAIALLDCGRPFLLVIRRKVVEDGREEEDDIQWSLAKDEIVIKVNDLHYFFTFCVPKGSALDEEEEEDLLSYNLTILLKGLRRGAESLVLVVAERLEGVELVLGNWHWNMCFIVDLFLLCRFFPFYFTVVCSLDILFEFFVVH
ncbi:hypothetical protein Fmac_017897 [Flemingia macrophylla]|uniref:Uncharacterized protein n=1 Tax=Flemingia macrophylla TaxID=520843 RepID=A0ABD1M3L6_9FABA